MALPLKDAFTARALGIAWDNYQKTLGLPPYLGRSFFATDKMEGLDLKYIKGSEGLPVSLKRSSFDALAELRDPLTFSEEEQEMPFFRESYLVKEKDEQEYMRIASSADDVYAQQVLKNIMLTPMKLVEGANVIPEREIWQLLAPEDGSPKIVFTVGDTELKEANYDISGDYQESHFIELTDTDLWSDSDNSTPIEDLVEAQEQHLENTGENLSTFIMNQKTWKAFCTADDTKKQVLGVLAYQNGMRATENDVKAYLLENYGIEILVYNKLYYGEDGLSHTFIPDGIVSAIASGVTTLGTVWYGTTPEMRSGSISTGNLSIVETGVSIYSYTTPHPVNTHCVVSEIVLPSYEHMNSTFVMKVM